MEIPLTPEMQRSIREKVESGRYGSASEVVAEALRLLDERDRREASRFEELREAIRIGVEQADRGELGPLDVRGTLAQVRGRRGS